ncbi:MAG: spore maturation protein [Bacilli bacterium]|nr:spore maturation protein [Bacilli bacterium]
MTLISNIFIPLLVLFVVLYGIIKKVNVYDVFVNGAKEGVEIGISTFPYMLGMILGVNILIKSNVLDFILSFLNPFFELIKVPMDILPMALLRPVSGSASLSVLNNILQNFGADSFIGRLASTIQGSTDTTIYILTLYFGTVGIKKIRYSLWVGLLADLVGIISSIIVVSILF